MLAVARARLILAFVTSAAVAGVAVFAQGRSAPDVSQLPGISAEAAAGSRLWILLFDVSSMKIDDVQRARTVALRWVNTNMEGDDLVSVMSVSASLKLLQNFTSDAARVRGAVGDIVPPADRDTAGSDADAARMELDFFNNDLRLRGLRTLCTGLRPIPQKKAIVLFTAVRDRPGVDNQVLLRAATDACGQANTSINPVDVTIPRG
jgi:VWFA-related protein